MTESNKHFLNHWSDEQKNGNSSKAFMTKKTTYA